MKTLSECRLYAFVDTAYLNGRRPEDLARRLCDGGADLIQLRAKQAHPQAIQKMAETILPITQAANVGLIINDHFAVAQQVGAEFCHLGQEDFFGSGLSSVAQLRRTPLSPGLGLSTHAPADAARALAAGADYLAIGPVFATATKPEAKPVSLDYVRWAASHLTIPWFAIGGINPDNLDDVLAAGARRVCVVSAILCADDPVAACRQLKKRLLEAGERTNAALPE
jgi:thiamine-phosphate pyrophosphorylase